MAYAEKLDVFNPCNLTLIALVGSDSRLFAHSEGQELLLNDGRPNGEMLLSTGTVQENNKSDFLLFPTSLVPADRYYTMKSEILESVGLAPKELFPVFADRFPNQMLSYLRLARVQDPGLFAKVRGLHACKVF